MNSLIRYRIFYWVPNTLSGERIAAGLCLQRTVPQTGIRSSGKRRSKRQKEKTGLSSNLVDVEDPANIPIEDVLRFMDQSPDPPGTYWLTATRHRAARREVRCPVLLTNISIQELWRNLNVSVQKF